MSRKFMITGAGLILGLVVSATGFAQTPQASTQTGPEGAGMGRHGRMGGGEGHGLMGVLSQLNLTDDQKQRIHTVIQNYQASTKPQREEMRQLRQQKEQGALTADQEARLTTLRDQMRTSMQSQRNEILAILTDDQRAQFAQLEKQQKTKHEGGRRPGGQGGVQ